jgi:hypothetical protein
MIEVDEEPHPDPNEENYPGMIYIGRMNDEGKRVGFDADNGRMHVSIISSAVSPTAFVNLCLHTQ